jgi:hypothetical protein
MLFVDVISIPPLCGGDSDACRSAARTQKGEGANRMSGKSRLLDELVWEREKASFSSENCKYCTTIRMPKSNHNRLTLNCKRETYKVKHESFRIFSFCLSLLGYIVTSHRTWRARCFTFIQLSKIVKNL